MRYKEKGVLTVLEGQELEGLLVVGRKGATVLRTDDIYGLIYMLSGTRVIRFIYDLSKPYPEWF